MAYNILIKQEAIEDILEGWLYYEEIQQGLGDRFQTAVNKRLQECAEHPTHYSFLSFDSRKIYRSVMINRFPFQIIYEVTKDTVIIYGILHAKRHPLFLFKRLSE